MPLVPALLVEPKLSSAPARQHGAAASRPARFRGQAFRSLLGAIGATCDSAALDEVLALLPTEAGSLLRRSEIVGTAWYPVEWLAALHAAAQAVTGRGPELARELGRDAMRMDARGIYQFVLRFVSPESLIRHAQLLVGLYVEGPRLTVGRVVPGEGHVTFRFDNALGYDSNVWLGVLGSCEALIELAGAYAPRARCVDGGGDAGWLAGDIRWG